MNAPRRPDGPPVRDGKPYSAIAHLAEDIVPYVALAGGAARASGSRRRRSCMPISITASWSWKISAWIASSPAIRRRRSRQRYAVAVDLLAALHGRRLPETLPVAPHLDYRLPRYDIGGLSDRSRTAARLVSGQEPAGKASRWQSRRAQGIRRAVEQGARARARRRRRPGCCATIIRPICSGCRSAATSRGSACSIFKTR